jgi:hypothetical protein
MKIIFLILTSCASSNIVQHAGPFTIRLCDAPTFYVYPTAIDPAQLEFVKAGFEYWNEALSTRLFIDGGAVGDALEVSEGYILVQFVSEIVIEEESRLVCGNVPSYSVNMLNGCVSHQSIQISTACENKGSDAGMASVVRHEIGHAMGLSHSAFEADLMFEAASINVSFPKSLSDAELEELKEVY